MMESAIREELNDKTPRVMAVLKPLKVVLTNWEEGKVETLEPPLFPEAFQTEQDQTRTRHVPLTREIYIEQDDFMIDPPKKYFRLRPGGEVRLRYGYIIKCEEVITDPKTGEVVELRCTYDPDTKSGTKQTRKVKGTIHWVSATHGKDLDVNLYESMLQVPNADETLAQEPDKTILDLINPNSLVKRTAKVEPYVMDTISKYVDANDMEQALPRFQLERQGFFAVDLPDPSDVKSAVKDQPPTLNRVVGLRDTWAKIDQKQRKNNNTITKKAAKKAPGATAVEGAAGAPARRRRSLTTTSCSSSSARSWTYLLTLMPRSCGSSRLTWESPLAPARSCLG